MPELVPSAASALTSAGVTELKIEPITPERPVELLDVRLAEVVFYNKRLTDEEREAGVYYLRTKWGMNYGVGNIENDVEVKAQLVFVR